MIIVAIVNKNEENIMSHFSIVIFRKTKLNLPRYNDNLILCL